jgi:hypothetical protein
LPASFKILPKLDLLYFFGYGHCTFDDLFSAGEKADQDPFRKGRMFKLVDLLNVTELDIDIRKLSKHIRHIERHAFSSLGPEPTVIVSRNKIFYAIPGLYKTLAGDIPLNHFVCSTMTEAIDWLGLEDNRAVIIDSRLSFLKLAEAKVGR